jgi:hypothetical protein
MLKVVSVQNSLQSSLEDFLRRTLILCLTSYFLEELIITWYWRTPLRASFLSESRSVNVYSAITADHHSFLRRRTFKELIIKMKNVLLNIKKNKQKSDP